MPIIHHIRAIVVISAFFCSCYQASWADISVQRLELQIPSNFKVEGLKDVKTWGLGSGVTFKSKIKSGFELYMISDAGPIIPGPFNVNERGQSKPTRMFAAPQSSPLIATVQVIGNTARVTAIQKLKNSSGTAVSGRPPPELSDELDPIDLDLEALEFDPDGVDTEAIAMAADGSLWIADEYLPSMLHVNAKSGRILERLRPGQELPAIISARQPSRGFEGIAVATDGKVYAILQSVLDIHRSTADSATFIRIIEYDPKLKTTRTLAYPVSPGLDTKIGDIVAIGPGSFLAVETIKSRTRGVRSIVYQFSILEASDLSGRKIDQREAEFEQDSKKIFGKGRPIAGTIKKTKVLDLDEIAWPYDKTEGLSILPDLQTLILTHDNDFGFSAYIQARPDRFSITGDTLILKHFDADRVVRERFKDEITEVWVVKLARPI